MVTVDIFLEQASIQYSQSGNEQLIVAGNLVLVVGGKIVQLLINVLSYKLLNELHAHSYLSMPE